MRIGTAASGGSAIVESVGVQSTVLLGVEVVPSVASTEYSYTPR
jgi:hypothetical protein